jgi:two-component system sensor histidine kinase PilS (NtrC family)
MSSPAKYIFSSKILSDSTPREGTTEYWRSLFYLNIYRMLLSVFLITASLTSFSVGSLGSRHPDLFAYTSVSYGFLSLLFAYFIYTSRPGYITQCRLQIFTDLIIIILLYHSSSGRGAGLEILFYITVSASGILLGGRAALATAAAATILLILEHFYVISTGQRALGGFTTLGFIGSGLFITAYMIYSLTLLLRKTEVEIAQQSQDLQKLGFLNELIVEQLHSGVMVIDQALQVILINNSGKNLLSIPEKIQLPVKLSELARDLSLDMNKLLATDNRHESMIGLPSGKMLLASFMPLGDTYQNGYIILLDDHSQIEAEKRNEKFIAMGRLSASIAHEIRNPLGAISHAGQLLAESPSIYKNDSRLVEIIENQSKRINQIIRTILELGQSNDQNFQNIALYDWLDGITAKFIDEHKLSADMIQLTGSATICACGDPQQLQQVILNLLSNSLRYADTSSSPLIKIKIDENSSDSNTTISVSDNGPGIGEDIRDKIFEPFFTTSSTGSGLGLYIARKICLSNNGYLDYFKDRNGNGSFLLSLSSDKTCLNTSDDK